MSKRTADPPIIRVLSLGAGVQSSTLLAMAAAGEFATVPDYAVFADTQAEPASVYEWLAYLESAFGSIIPILRVSRGSLGADGTEMRRSAKSGRVYLRTLVPTFTRNPDGSRGILRRKCTRDYKVDVILRECKRLANVKRGEKSVRVENWIGISRDEAHRMKDSLVPWATNCYPLVERRISRADCLRWMAERGLPKPPRSACVFCPYHSDDEWQRLKREEPAEFRRAVEWERVITANAALCEVTKGVPFLHDSLIPLDQVRFDAKRDQPSLFGNECEGMCGV